MLLVHFLVSIIISGKGSTDDPSTVERLALRSLAEDGDFARFKPSQCVTFPLDQLPDGRWYVRQHGYEDEEWDLFCLDPKNSARRAVEALAAEIDYAARSVPGAAGTAAAGGVTPDSVA